MSNLAKKQSPTTMKGSKWWGVWLFFILVFVDQITKMVADVYFNTPGSPSKIDVIPGWLSLTIEYNRGISYGMGSDVKSWIKLAVIIATAVIMTAFAIAYFRIDNRRSWMKVAIVLIVAGGIGNLIDRVYYRVWDVDTLFGVRDMVDLSRFGFAVCNFADFFITGGAIVLVLAMLFFDRDAFCPLTKKYKLLAKEQAKKDETERSAKRK